MQVSAWNLQPRSEMLHMLERQVVEAEIAYNTGEGPFSPKFLKRPQSIVQAF